MKRYTNKELANMNANRFAINVLRDEAKGRDVYQPTTQRLQESIAYLHMMEETSIPFSLLCQIFRAWEATNPSRHLSALIVYSADSFNQPNFHLIQRSYVISSDNKAFQPGMTSGAIFGDCLDCLDRNVRLDVYMTSGKDNKRWKVERCYLLSPDYRFPAIFA